MIELILSPIGSTTGIETTIRKIIKYMYEKKQICKIENLIENRIEKPRKSKSRKCRTAVNDEITIPMTNIKRGFRSSVLFRF
jgi:peptide subunit release factor 1 (eRF1)